MLRATAAIAEPLGRGTPAAGSLRGNTVRLLAATALAQGTFVMVAIVIYGSLQPRHMADFHVMRRRRRSC